ncbi:MAG: FAD-binding oxidoreductase [Acidobacteriaceae bacterium]|nr:FAD-binding oxidoreductase [Acidobacteriaceae bacterium]
MLIQISSPNSLTKAGGTYPRRHAQSEIETVASVDELERELRRSIAGDVRFDAGHRALYATDASNYRQAPIGVVVPRTKDDVVQTMAACRRWGAPVLSRGGGTSLAGQCCNVAVVIDYSKYLNRVLAVDSQARTGRIEPGCVLDEFRRVTKRDGLIFGPDPATHNRCTLGGMAGNNSCGMHAQMAGKTADNIVRMEVLTYDGLRMWVGETSEESASRLIGEAGRKGEIFNKLRNLRDRYADLIRKRFPKIPRLVSGYGLDHLLPENGFNVARALVGTEGTCVAFLEIEGKLVPNPEFRTLLVLGYADIFSAGDAVPQLLEYKPIAFEGFNGELLDDYRKKGLDLKEITLMPQGNGWLVLEFGGDTKEEATEKARTAMEDLKRKTNAPQMKVYEDEGDEGQIWEVRESALGAVSFVPGENPAWPGWEDSAVAPEKLGSYLRGLQRLFHKHGWKPAIFGHFGHGCLHIRIPFDLVTHAGLAEFAQFMDEASTLVVEHGGSISGEHGDGQARAQFQSKVFGDELVEAFREFKSIWDPEGKMNPGKMVDPYTIVQNLRLGTNYDPPHPQTHFSFAADGHSFATATLRCMGVGLCRRTSGGTMCPSYMATREEMHSTRGRAHLLFEMLQGDPLGNGWRDEHVKAALDLCLSCKGCKGDCPINVDMATYKSEFLSHYYEGRIRPRHAYASGLIYWWARAASHMPALANFFTQTPGLSSLAKLAAGYSQKRTIPAFAPQTFKQWFAQRGPRNAGRPPVLLWADTFNNYFTPKVAQAAVEVLEDAGYQVKVAKQSLCCGRPLYDYGMLDTATVLLRQNLRVLRPVIEAGTPVIGLEPSCVTVFRDEMPDLLHGDESAKRLQRQTFLLSEFLQQKNKDYRPPRLARKAVIHGHCHHKSSLKFDSEKELLHNMGLDCDILDSGCCGMAGAFGYEAEHYELGIQCGERVLLPAVRKAPRDALIIADGFSCREQILQETDRRALHLSQVLQMALHSEAARELPEIGYAEAERTPAVPLSVVAAAALIGAGVFWGSRALRRFLNS